MEEVDLKNFQVVKNEEGVVFIDKTNVMLQNASTGEVLTTSFDNVSSFYGLDSHSSDAPMAPGEDDNYQEYSPEASLKESPEDSFDDEAMPEDTPSAVSSRPPIKWGHEETKFLLQLYSKLITCVGPDKKFRTKKLMWAHLATLIQRKFKISPNATQVETRYKCVSKRTKKPNLMIPIDKNVRKEIAYSNERFAKCDQEDPIGIETVMSQGRIFMLPREPVVSLPPPAPSTLLKMIPEPPEQDEQDILEGDNTQNPVRRNRKPPQVVMFEKYLQQKAEFYERREAKTDERARKKAEREKEKERHKQQREKEKIEREKEKELMKQQRHLEKMKLLREILNKSFKK
ncbi:uncharacterized protein LOC129949963 [Eupeodes corollae]|uniref:uncharacterized protein LOC129949963 n=1 Tax=Eupeodes corollae TaxID=290404 RepID=UPI0024933FCD|nr:uncharacterized protein LOC129949963 [Eupeodes corollae]